MVEPLLNIGENQVIYARGEPIYGLLKCVTMYNYAVFELNRIFSRHLRYFDPHAAHHTLLRKCGVVLAEQEMTHFLEHEWYFQTLHQSPHPSNFVSPTACFSNSVVCSCRQKTPMGLLATHLANSFGYISSIMELFFR